MYQPISRFFDGKTFYQIPGFVDYWISADDEVISDKGRTHYLKVHFGYHGYYRVHLQHGDHKTFPNLHRLKMMAMITGPLQFDQKVDHIDANPRNNRLENLQVTGQHRKHEEVPLHGPDRSGRYPDLGPAQAHALECQGDRGSIRCLRANHRSDQIRAVLELRNRACQRQKNPSP